MQRDLRHFESEYLVITFAAARNRSNHGDVVAPCGR